MSGDYKIQTAGLKKARENLREPGRKFNFLELITAVAK